MPVVWSLCLLVLSAPAWAQEGRQGREGRGGRQGQMPRVQQLSPEKVQAARTWQAREVARALKLETDETARLVEVYLASRKKFDKALRELREAERDGERRRMRRIDPQVVAEHRAALESQLLGFLPGEQAKEAMPALGAFNGQWDRMVDAVTRLGLGEDQVYAALVPIREYVVQISGAQRAGDWEAMRGIMVEAREGLYDDLGKVLTEDQLARFQEAAGRRGGRQGRQRGEGRARGEQIDTAGIGKPAPVFTLADSEGKAYTLADYRGKTVVLQWINPDCPVCKRTCAGGKVTAMRKQLDEVADGIVHLAVNSTHYMEPSVGAAYFKGYKIDAPVLIDRDGTVGHLYGAKRTPHMYVIDAQGILRYQGAIDDDPDGVKGDQASNYVVQAVRQIAAGETVAPDTTRAYGCTVKYAPRQPQP
jgi:peroxiredoxin